MSKVFKVTPKRINRTNGTVLTPEMTITVTAMQHPFYNGEKEIKEMYMRIYSFDY
jgi:ribosomal protein L31